MALDDKRDKGAKEGSGGTSEKKSVMAVRASDKPAVEKKKAVPLGGGGGGSKGPGKRVGGSPPRRGSALAQLLSYGPPVAVLFGLMAVFLGQRPFQHIGEIKSGLTGLGTVLILAALAMRIWTFLRSEGKQRSIELILLASYAVVPLALLGYVLTTDGGMAALGITEKEAVEKFRTALTVVWLILLGLALIPLITVELTIGFSGRYAYLLDRAGGGGSVESFRVREAALNGLTIAMAAAFLMVTCNTADQRNIRKDVSYFKTSSPGSSTVAIAADLKQPLKVLLFFPDVNPVAAEVESYFEALNQESGGKLEIQRYDRLADGEVAREYKATRDGTIVLALGEKSEKLSVDPDFEKARRNELREIDKQVQQALMKVVRQKKVAYLTVGHGELSQSDVERPDVLGMEGSGIDRASHFREWLRVLNYDVQEYRSFGQPIPEDASVVVVLAPLEPLSDEELKAIDDYLARGGSLLFVLDPTGKAGLGLLEKRLGVRFNASPLADDQLYRPIRRRDSDHQYIATTQFSAHAAVTTASRAGANVGIVFLQSGSIEEVDTPGAGPKPRRTQVVKSMSTAWRDLDGDWNFGAGEQRDRYNIMTTIEEDRPPMAPGQAGEEKGMRAIVLADAELFSDLVLKPEYQVTLPQMIVVDAIRWLGGEEKYAGDTVVEKDVKIVHTRSEDVVWFYSTILGAPFMVLALGMAWVYWRRRRTFRRA